MARNSLSKQADGLPILRPIMSGDENQMSDVETAQAKLRTAIEDLRRIRERLRVLQESLAVDRTEGDERAQELGSVIDCVLLDSLGPAIRDLLAVTDESVRGRRPGG
jgi:hypothetical protein